MCTGKPLLTSSGQCLNGKWKWDPVVWVKCKICNLHHSNRIFPKEFLDCEWGLSQVKTKAGIILIKNNEIFMTETYHTHLGFPKGEKEPNETIKECAEREFYEETGTYINISHYNYKIIKMNIYSVLYVFYVIICNDISLNTLPIDTKEITSFGWLSIDRIKYLKLVSNISKIIIGIYLNHFF
jgi:8-oxo-dGTP pyrophosphatase MutT (NUDIX family)